MTVYLDQILDLALLDKHVHAGLVSMQGHPHDDLVIFNYTHRCQYDRVWDDVTRQCRGLIIRQEDTAVIARPFRKFFNYGEHTEGTFSATEPVITTNKYDGSLGILYPTQSSYAIATRGSFTSEQAVEGSSILHEYLALGWVPQPDVTYLFEIIYPRNRIVVDYGTRRDLILLDVLDTDTGKPSDNLHAFTSWPGPDAETFLHLTFADALAEPPRPNAEGLVVYFPLRDERIKLKQEDYVALHRIVTGLNERIVWEQLGEGKTAQEICEPLPEEFHDWVYDVTSRLLDQAAELRGLVHEAYQGAIINISCEGQRDWTRKDFALLVQQPQYADIRPYLFMRLDGKDIGPAVWAKLKPAAVPPRDWEEVS